jgi:hypothetical protein
MNLSRLVLICSLAGALSGCAVALPFPGRSTTGTRTSALTDSKPKCKPSQHWDGEKCRHNGKGEGARKHDDR